MARKKVNYYKFTPGAAGAGTVKVLGNFDLGDFLMITNVTTNTVIYNFGDPNRGGSVVFNDGSTDNSFSVAPGVKQSLNNGLTILTLDFDTSSMSASDVLQIYVETVELRVRPYDFAIDAVERQRVAIPRSLIDADFEYGLQTTKWASFFTYRQTPTTFAVDGTDFAVNAYSYVTMVSFAHNSGSPVTPGANSPMPLTVANQGNVTVIGNVFVQGDTATTYGNAAVPYIGSTVSDSAPKHYQDDYKLIIHMPPGRVSATQPVGPGGISYINNVRPITPANGGPFQRTFSVKSTDHFYVGDVIIAVGLPTPDGTLATSPFVSFTASGSGTGSLTANGTQTIANGALLACEIGTIGSGEYELMSVSAAVSASAAVPVVRQILGTNYANAAIPAGAKVFAISTGVSANHMNSVRAMELMRIDAINSTTKELTVTRGWFGTNANATFGPGTVIAATNLRPFYTFAQWQANLEIVKTAHGVTGATAAASVSTVDFQTAATTSIPKGAQSPALLGILRNPTQARYPNAGFGAVAKSGGIPAGSIIVNLSGMTLVGNTSAPFVLINANAPGIGSSLTSANVGNSWVATYGTTGSYQNANVEGVFVNQLSDVNYVGFTPKMEDISKYPGYPLIPGVEAAVLAPRFKKGGIFVAANLTPFGGNIVITSNAGTPSLITVKTQNPHALVPGTPIQTILSGTAGCEVFASGVHLVSSVPTPDTFAYVAKGAVTNGTITGGFFAFPTALVKHRPLDGGTNIGINAPSYGFEATRQTRKYFRYQSGKGMMFTTGTQFNPVFSIANVSANAGAVGAGLTVSASSGITCSTVVEHGMQRGANVRIYGLNTTGYNDYYRVDSVQNAFTFTVKAKNTLGAQFPVILGGNVADRTYNPRVVALNWRGSKVRAGMYDDGNGVFWEYDGQYLWAVKRSATYEMAGSISVGNNDNRVVGDSNTRFQDNVGIGDQIQLRGIVHDVIRVESQNVLYIAPVYRGVQNAVNIPFSLVKEVRTRSANFNLDRLDGTGPSGYVIDLSKMQMVAIQYTWYGAGFIDWGMRTTEGKMIWAHRLKNNNVNDEGFMRSGNLPARYQAVNRGIATALTVAVPDGTWAGNLQVAEIDEFPGDVSEDYPGIVMVNGELIQYTAKYPFTYLAGNTQGNLGGLTRAVRYAPNVLDAQRDLTGFAAAAHAAGSGVMQYDITASPDLNHWGSAVILDGDFDIDRTYSFTYSLNSCTVSAAIGQPQTLFMIRLAPSLGSGVPGDLGIRDTLNRAQLLLQNCYINFSATDARALLVGIVNPINVEFAAWQNVNIPGNQNAPSFSQFVANASAQIGSAFTNLAVNKQNAQIRWGIITNPQPPTVNQAGGTTPQIVPYAFGGEQLFSIPVSGTNSGFVDLSRVKEVGGAIFPGNQVYPNGPEVIAFNIIPLKKSGNNTAAFTGDFNVDFQLTWIESQA